MAYVKVIVPLLIYGSYAMASTHERANDKIMKPPDQDTDRTHTFPQSPLSPEKTLDT